MKQTHDGPWVTLFAAPAEEIHKWAGIPQRTTFGSSENIGFQRTDNQKRLADLAKFYSNGSNVVQNPLLCALQIDEAVTFSSSFEPDPSGNQVGQLIIDLPDLDSYSLAELIAQVRERLEMRVPELATSSIPQVKLNALRKEAHTSGDLEPVSAPDMGTKDELEDSDLAEFETDEQAEVGEALATDESHLVEFWENLLAREILLGELGDHGERTEFLGYSRAAMEVYLRPTVLVDGQHRLLGAIRASNQKLTTDEILDQIDGALRAGKDQTQIADEITNSLSRRLPISLLMSDKPSEHVFQFVVVNQKATPIGRPLLGTIISTSLSNSELAEVRTRLEDSGIPLEDSRIITFMARQELSPFCGLIRRGVNDTADLLDWQVLGSLIDIFRKLKGGRLYHEKIDAADKWRRDYLPNSALVVAYADKGYSSEYEYWSDYNGPWREVFLRFWAEVRSRLGSADPSSGNFWSDPRISNLFNKISLTILASDFFKFLIERARTIDAIDDVSLLAEAWLQGVNPNYFARDWKLEGVKKDSPGTRNQWAYLWQQYRVDPQRLPPVSEYRKVRAS